VPGALLATLGIFLPSFLFVALSNPLVPRLRRSRWAAGFLDGANAASVALMAVVTWQLGRAALVDWLTVVLAAAAAVLLLRFRVNSAWLSSAAPPASWPAALRAPRPSSEQPARPALALSWIICYRFRELTSPRRTPVVNVTITTRPNGPYW
jgi:chromate transport protein ChrA